MVEVNWHIVLVIQQILQRCCTLEVVSFSHILHEWNSVVDCLAKWALDHVDDWKVEWWGQLSPDYCHDLERISADGMEG